METHQFKKKKKLTFLSKNILYLCLSENLNGNILFASHESHDRQPDVTTAENDKENNRK